MTRSLVWPAFFAIACGGPAAGSGDPAKIEVPPQPPQVVPPVAATPVPVKAAPVAVAPFACKGGTRFTEKDTEYCGHDDAMTWEAAEARCVSEGGHLLALENAAARDKVHGYIGSPVANKRAMWIGLELANKAKHTWKWTTGEAVTAASWSQGEPNDFDGHEACGEWLVATGKWNDTRCELEQPFLCGEIPNSQLKCRETIVAADGNYCYFPFDAKYADAKKGCVRIGGALATPKTMQANDLLTRAMAQRFHATRMWIGLNDLAEHGAWTWTTGAPAGFTDWKSGEPNNYRFDEHCTELFADTWQWNDLDCAEKLPSVCQAPANAR